MNFKIGDKVNFLNEKGEGTVSKIINKTTVGITIEDGLEIPFSISELILVYDKITAAIPPQKTEKSTTSLQIKLEKTQFFNENKFSGDKKFDPEGIYIAFSPEKINDIQNSNINIWLINNTKYKILFTCSLFQNKNFVTLETGTVKENESVLIETINRKKLEDFSTFKIETLFFNEKEHVHQAPVSEIIKLKPIKLYKENAFSQNNFISEKALIIPVTYLNNTINKEIQETSKIDLSKLLVKKKVFANSTKISKPNVSNDPAYEMEINLHIEELMDNYKGMSNAEIIKVQLKHFQFVLDKAINEHYRKLIVIHGVGNGRLKQEVRTIIDSYDHLQYYDASYNKYGFGATEISIS